ncbi:MAG: putative DNA (cytosine-5)-methyltransferase [Prokaryotic dsDNA virus sp.]|jgi:hypothetical protein|nr:MAG: putative DNA (cytosine-5)-methyltransferase [Prokaryotic dsDNA virus sp.]|tara:strand:+ start:11917 stop:12594 length:678 start_codon:yes stop_codon:yes gene_type:complete
MANILIGYSCCPLTRAAFEKHGHDVWTCDLLPARDFSRKHHQCDVWEVMGNKWDLAILHPMCTYLTVSAAWAYADPDYDKYPGVGYHQRVKPGTLVGEDRRAARDIELENFRALLDLPFPVAIENPAVSFINKAIRGPDQVIHPHQFGDDASKATGLWLTRGLPKLALDPAKQVAPRMVNGRPRWANQTDSGQNRLSPSDDRWLERSKTYPGIAAAMGDQWGAIL